MAAYGRNRMTYDPRRLRLHELIECIPFTRRYALSATDCERSCATTGPTPACCDLRCPWSSRPRRARPPGSNRAVASFDREVQQLGEGHGLAA